MRKTISQDIWNCQNCNKTEIMPPNAVGMPDYWIGTTVESFCCWQCYEIFMQNRLTKDLKNRKIAYNEQTKEWGKKSKKKTQTMDGDTGRRFY